MRQGIGNAQRRDAGDGTRAPGRTQTYTGARPHGIGGAQYSVKSTHEDRPVNITGGLLPAAWQWPALFVFAALVLHAIHAAPWRQLCDPSRLNAWLGSIVLLLMLWMLRAGIQPGLGFHLLGATVCTLMFGPHLALIAMSLVVGAAAAAGTVDATSIPVNALVMGAVPVAVSFGVLRATQRWLPSHFFVYIFGVAFFGGALAMLATGLAASGLLVATGAYPFETLRADYLPWYLLMSWAEAFSTGGALTLLVVYRPQWVATFDDARYIAGK
jgi:uncharacterized membrane protein